jgi:hypothetical protein
MFCEEESSSRIVRRAESRRDSAILENDITQLWSGFGDFRF